MGWEDNINGLSNSNSNFMQAFNSYVPKENYLAPSDLLMPTQQMNFSLPGLSMGNSVPASNAWTDWFGKDGKLGYANTAMDLGKGLFGMWAGIKGMQRANEQFAFNKENILRDRSIKEGMLARSVALQDQNRAAARGYTPTNQSATNIPSIPILADQMKKYGA